MQASQLIPGEKGRKGGRKSVKERKKREVKAKRFKKKGRGEIKGKRQTFWSLQ